MAESARDKFHANMRGLFASGDYSDLTITCGPDTYKVHKIIVCSPSEFFRKAGNGDWKEAAEGVIDLPEDDPVLVKLLMQYLYEAEYEPKLPESHAAHVTNEELLRPKRKIESSGSDEFHYNFPHTCSEDCSEHNSGMVCDHHICIPRICKTICNRFVCKYCCPEYYVSLKRLSVQFRHGDASQLLLHSQMYALADKYQVDGLKDLAREKFMCCCVVFWDTNDFPLAARHVFDSTPGSDRDMRSLIAATLSDHLELLNNSDIAALLDEPNGLAVDMLRRKVDTWVGNRECFDGIGIGADGRGRKFTCETEGQE